MFELFQSSITRQVAPRVALLLWGFRHVPFIHAFGDLDFWVMVGALTLIFLSIGLDCWQIRRKLEARQSASYWADLRARHSDPEIDVDQDLL